MFTLSKILHTTLHQQDSLHFNFQQKINSGQSSTCGGKIEHFLDEEPYSVHKHSEDVR
jgi:hypothetical protein